MVRSEVVREVGSDFVGEPLLVADPLQQAALKRLDPDGALRVEHGELHHGRCLSHRHSSTFDYTSKGIRIWHILSGLDTLMVHARSAIGAAARAASLPPAIHPHWGGPDPDGCGSEAEAAPVFRQQVRVR